MKRVFATILFLSVLLASLASPGFGALGSSVISVEVTHQHSHSHDGEEHHHESMSFHESGRGGLPDSASTQPDEDAAPHSHHVLIAVQFPVVLPSHLEFGYLDRLTSIQKNIDELDPPVDRSLGAIFRPPIQA